MTRTQLIPFLKRLQKEELDLISTKNKDYGAEEDPFANFQWFGELGFLVRMSDKLMRLKHILENREMNVKDESVKDTLMDLSNYANLLIAYLSNQENKI